MRIKKAIDLGCIILLLAYTAWCSHKTLYAGNVFPGENVSLRHLNLTGPDWYVTSVLVACHKGFRYVNPESIPGLPGFLRQDRLELPQPQLPPDDTLSRPGFDEMRHRYLLTLVGKLWGLFGISWRVVRYLSILFLCAAAGIIYCIFRLGMGPLISMAGSLLFVMSPTVQQQLFDLRDLAKAPFVLAAILIMGYLAKHRVTKTRLLALALALGLVAGIGFGFRTDSAMCLLPGAVVLLFFDTLKPKPNRLVKCAAVALLFVVFIAAGWPVVLSEYRGGSLFSHFFLMGLCTDDDQAMGVERASYERMYQDGDEFVFFTRPAYIDRMRIETPATIKEKDQANWQNRLLVWEFIKTFPGDMATRAYSAALTVAGKNELFPRIESYRVYLIAATLFLLACYRLSWGWGALIVGLYFCGMMSYQFQTRHVFHLTFLNWWMLGFLVQRALAGTILFVRKRYGMLRGRATESAPVRMSLRRGLFFAAGAIPFILVPLYGLRVCQDQALERLLYLYRHAGLERAETDSRPLGNWVLFAPRHRLKLETYQAQQVKEHAPSQYWVLEVADPPPYFRVALQYDVGAVSDGSDVLLAGPFSGGNKRTRPRVARYFFPVYETDRGENARLRRFAGVALSPKVAPKFKALYLVKNVNDFPLLLNLSLPEAPSCFLSRQTLHFAPRNEADPGNIPFFNARQHSIQRRVSQVVALEKADPVHAVETARAALLRFPRHVILYLLLAESLEAQGKAAAAINTYRMALTVCSDYAPVYRNLDTVLVRLDNRKARVKLWRQIAREYPDAFYPHEFLACALADVAATETHTTKH